MNSSSAYNFYGWSKDLEKANSMLRLLSCQLEQLPKDSSQTLAVGWEWIFKSLNVKVPSGLLLEENKKESSDFCQADAYTLVDYFTFEAGHKYSILNCFQSAQKKSKKYPNTTITTLLNPVCLLLNNTSMKDVWPQNKTLDFYKKLQTYVGLLYSHLDNNFYRGNDFYFIQLGRFIERLELIISILNTHAQYVIGWKNTEKELNNLLSYCGAFDLYKQIHGSEKNIQKVFDFIVSEPRSPSSLLFFLNQIEASIQNINLNTSSDQILEIIRSLKESILSSSKLALIPFLESTQVQSKELQKELLIYFQHPTSYTEELKKHG